MVVSYRDRPIKGRRGVPGVYCKVLQQRAISIQGPKSLGQRAGISGRREQAAAVLQRDRSDLRLIFHRRYVRLAGRQDRVELRGHDKARQTRFERDDEQIRSAVGLPHSFPGQERQEADVPGPDIPGLTFERTPLRPIAHEDHIEVRTVRDQASGGVHEGLEPLA